MEPLSPDDSEMLFCKRIFPDESGCPPEFEQVSKAILKKCGGVPLAIITLASLLASDQYVNSKDEWQILLKSIGRGLTEDPSLEEMQRILSFSYYDLPSHLKTCLLYLSIYPEDEKILKDRLIWKWVAEGFVQCQNQGTRLFELGETYFNELINRNMIQPFYSYTGELWGCHVHDMVLDLICSLSSEENFVTVLNCTRDVTPSLCSARRLSIQNGNRDSQTTLLIKSASSQVRSVTMFQPAINLLPSLSGFSVLRVLDLMERHQPERTSRRLNVTDIGKLLHLRYLCLSYTGVDELPAEIGDLQFLEFLQVMVKNDLKELPQSFGKLRRLMFLYISGNGECKMPPGMLGKLTSLEVLRGIRATTVNIVQELGNLSRLRELDIYFSEESNPELYEAFMKSLFRLHHMESLVGRGTITYPGGLMDLLEEQWVPSQRLRKYRLHNSRKLYTLPTWIKRDPSHLSNLSELCLRVKGLQQEDMQILGVLVALHDLTIRCTRQTQRRLVIGADGFRRVVSFNFGCGSAAQIIFEPGALPRAKDLVISLGVRVAKDDGNGNFELGLKGNLLSLRHSIYVNIYRVGATVGEAEEAEAAVRRAIQDHPNHLRLVIPMRPAIPKDVHDDDICEEDEEA